MIERFTDTSKAVGDCIPTRAAARPRVAVIGAGNIVRNLAALNALVTIVDQDRARRVEIVSAPLFPRYLFVLIDLASQRWRAVESTFGVHHLTRERVTIFA